jgi:hypothetical protein
MAGTKVFAAVFVPVKVSVRAVFEPASVKAVVALLYVTAPVPDASSVPPLVPSVMLRFVLTVAPVYCSVPPLRMRLTALVVADPIPLAVPPAARLLVLSVPPLMVVLPV